MSTNPFFMFGNTGSEYNINVNSLKFNNINTGFVYLGNTGLASVKQIQTAELADSSIITTKIANGSVTGSKIQSSVNLTGIPTVDTAETGTNTTQIATTAFVQSTITNLVNTAPASLDTLDELANALGDNANFSATVTTNIAGKISKTGNESISGVKTFTQLPECSSEVTTSNQLTNKSYVDSITQGLNGTPGLTGAQGEQGAQGGFQGAQGDQGGQGAQGDQGAQGAQGAQGTTGGQGAQGSQGIQGARGTQGPTGVQGATGSSSSILIQDNNTDSTMYPVFTDGSGSLKTLYIDNNTSYNPSTRTLSCTNLILERPITITHTNAAAPGQIGYIQTATFTSSQSLTNDTFKNLGSITLGAGTWIVLLNVNVNTSSVVYTGYSIEISTSSTEYINDISLIRKTIPNTISSATRNFYYNTHSIYYSGTSFTLYGNVTTFFSGGGSVTGQGAIQAVRIA